MAQAAMVQSTMQCFYFGAGLLAALLTNKLSHRAITLLGMYYYNMKGIANTRAIICRAYIGITIISRIAHRPIIILGMYNYNLIGLSQGSHSFKTCTLYCPEIEAKIVACLLRASAFRVPSFSRSLYSCSGRRGSLRLHHLSLGGYCLDKWGNQSHLLRLPPRPSRP